ncbi:MAG: CIA30 family protein [Bdellovibrio sp.]|jgi:NADH dehydrogenase [ubiquinone] 1 alpha subcomplex assembly factor 1
MKSFFGSLVLFYLLGLSAAADTGDGVQKIIQFSDASQDSFWSPLTDQLRFGKNGSTAFMSVDWTRARATFYGDLNLNQGVGFSSYRLTQDMDLSEIENLRISVRGDGREYKILIKDEASVTSGKDYSYQSSFKTQKDVEMMIVLKLSDFKPISRGRVDPTLPELSLRRVKQLGIQINDRRQGPFRIEFGEWLGIPKL